MKGDYDAVVMTSLLCDIATGLVLPWTDITDTEGDNCLSMLDTYVNTSSTNTSRIL